MGTAERGGENCQYEDFPATQPKCRVVYPSKLQSSCAYVYFFVVRGGREAAIPTKSALSYKDFPLLANAVKLICYGHIFQRQKVLLPNCYRDYQICLFTFLEAILVRPHERFGVAEQFQG